MKSDRTARCRCARLLAPLLAVAMLSACKDRPTQLKQQIQMAEDASASPDELCRRKRELAEAYLQARDERNYRLYYLSAEAYCYRIESQRALQRTTR